MGHIQLSRTIWSLPSGEPKARPGDPALGRFYQTDPVLYADQFNLYAYVGNDPLNMTDPTGMVQRRARVERVPEEADYGRHNPNEFTLERAANGIGADGRPIGRVGGDILLIDVREANEYGLERIPGALLYPLSTLDPKAIPVGGPKRVVFHCAAGRRSAMAAMRCQDEGVNVDAHLAGGLGAWKEAQLPLIETDPLTGQVKGG